MATEVWDLIRGEKLPHIWCPGCGHGTLMNALLRTLAKLEVNKDDICVVSGIGCASRLPGYLDFNTLHTTHGRALAFATGIKLANPKLKVIVVSGDGDASAIGGNHLIHAARRNMDLTLICMNNNIYGMTNGQYSPMTPTDMLATTSPYGNLERNFDLCKLVESCGANYVARATAAHPRNISTYIEYALTHDGFNFVEVMTQCPTYYGRRNKMGGPVEMLNAFKANTILNTAAAKLPPEQVAGKILIGEFVKKSEPTYLDRYEALAKKLTGGVKP